MTKSVSFFVTFLFFAMSSFAQLNRDWSIDVSQPIPAIKANQIVTYLLTNTKVVAKDFFCVKNDLICRVHYTLADASGKVIAPFFVRFMAADRSVASQGYFFPTKHNPNLYVRFEDFTFDGQVNVDKVETSNLVPVQKYSDGRFAVIRDIITPRLGTTKYTIATIIVGPKSTVLQGIMKDTQDPKYSEAVRTEYLRTQL